MRSYVVVSGIPASGKSTVGRAVAGELGWPFLDKDDFLEALFEQFGCATLDERRDLSRRADVRFEAAARSRERAVLCSFWRAPADESDSGTPSAWLRAPDTRVLEVVCRCPPDVAARRFLGRTRHPGHLDGLRSERELIARSLEVGAGLPLGLGESIEQDTDGTWALDDVIRVARAFAGA